MGWRDNGDEWRWRLTSERAQPTIAVLDASDDEKTARQEKVDAGAQVIPFGFARALPPMVERPLLWGHRLRA
jgi:hypothetical protein